jgi:hypothetical protein
MHTLPVCEARPSVLYARPQHGGFPIHVKPPAFHLFIKGPDQPPVIVQGSVKTLLQAIHPDLVKAHWSFNQYFRLGCYAYGSRSAYHSDETSQLPILDLFNEAENTPLSIPPTEVGGTPPLGLSIAPQILRPGGIDLKARAHEVRKLLFAGFGPAMARSGLDPEEVLQEVFKGILTRDQGKSRFDAKKSSFGHYIHMVCRCVLSNYRRKQKQRRAHEQIGWSIGCSSGAKDSAHGVGASADLALVLSTRGTLCPASSCGVGPGVILTTQPTAPTHIEEVQTIRSYQNKARINLTPIDASITIKALPLLYKGYTRSEIANALHLPPARVGRALTAFRKSLRGG